ncbi:hypothetical protein DH2020_017053 [Rehmannia glutinosa]|uniref:Uncharacterized protein n=1 Tax=Rehmannia glutinosa TaxID=99300 RepID=A0ABR0WPQ7_REHGL
MNQQSFGNTITVKQPPLKKHTRIKRLSTEEMMERRKHGKCYNCDNPWVKGHHSKQQLCMLDFEDEDKDMYDDHPELDISLHAITGVTNSQMMKFRVHITGVSVMALVNTRSTHNFINIETAHRLRLPISKRTGLQVAVANGEQVASAGICAPVILSQEELLDSIRTELRESKENREYLIKASTDTSGQWTLHDGLLLRDNKIFLFPTSTLIPTVLATIHNANHEGIQKTIRRIKCSIATLSPKLCSSQVFTQGIS